MSNLQLAGLINRAISAHQSGNLSEAEFLYKSVLAQDARQFDALHMLGVLRGQQADFVEAERFISRALQVTQVAEAHENHARVLLELKRYGDALRSADRALTLKPNSIAALNFRGGALLMLQKPELALESFDKALAVKADFPMTNYNRGEALFKLKRLDQSLAAFDTAIAIMPAYAQAWAGRGSILMELKRIDDAMHAFDRAMVIHPNNVNVLVRRGNAFREISQFDEALQCYEKALALSPGFVDAHYNRSVVLQDLRQWDSALISYERTIALDPDHRYAFGGFADCALMLCDWRRRDTLRDELRRHVIEERFIIAPYTLLGYLSDELLQLKCGMSSIRDRIVDLPSAWSGAVHRNDKIKIAYLSADFHAHPVSYLTAELFELHDRKRFELIGVSFGPDDRSEMRSRLVKAFDHFHDVNFVNDHDVAKLLNNLQVDIVVDLSGHTKGNRAGILAHRPAPIQVSYLGFPATMGANFIDYIITDPIVLPNTAQPYYSEKIVHLPECFLVNDRQRSISAQTPTREQAGLPTDEFVFCCFNNSWKITPELFDTWMRLLRAVERSVLWLSQANETAARNLNREAEARGVDPARLIFAPRVERIEDHLARQRLADLFLDTLPYNAHSTTADALWAGLPVLTCRGETFAGRVAASLLNAVGLPELVTGDLAGYEALALKLAREPALLAEIRAKLARNRDTYPLFDTERFTRHIEAAYTTMWEHWQRGETPKSFAVAPIRS